MNAIEARDVYKVYRRSSRRKQFATLKSAFLSGSLARDLGTADVFEALKGVSFDVAAGRTFGVIGRNGSGKSTMLNVLTDLLGTYAGPAPMEMLLVRGRNGKEVETQFAALAGKRLVTTVEADSGVRFSEATVKLLTGGDTNQELDTS